jgi:hypothetical protein
LRELFTDPERARRALSAFPHGSGRIKLCVERVGDQIDLAISDDGIGLKNKDSAKSPEKRGSDYVAILRAPAWRRRRAHQAGTDGNDRADKAALASDAIGRHRAAGRLSRAARRRKTALIKILLSKTKTAGEGAVRVQACRYYPRRVRSA